MGTMVESSSKGVDTILSERLLVEQLEVDEPVWDHSTFSKNRDRLLVLGGAKTCLTYPGPLQKKFSLV